MEKSKAGRDTAGSGAVVGLEDYAVNLPPSEQPSPATY